MITDPKTIGTPVSLTLDDAELLRRILALLERNTDGACARIRQALGIR
jgi:hypothetical protein